MKAFESLYSINFVDDSNVFVGYSLAQSCCENAGFAFCRSEQEFEDLTGENILYSAKDIAVDLEPYFFDATFFKESSTLNGDAKVLFRLVSEGEDDLFLMLINEHNGYYSHGFEFKDGEGRVIQEGNL